MVGLALRRGDGFKWIDYFSTSDLVANGPLGAVEGLTSSKVVNEMSWMNDHSAYWHSDEFIASVFREIDAVAATGLFRPADSVYLDRIAPARCWRVRLLLALRVAAVVGLIITIIGWWEQLGSIGVCVYRALQRIPGFEGVHRILVFAGQVGELAVRVLLGSAMHSPRSVRFELLGAVVVLGFWLGWYRVTLGLWRSWDSFEARRLFDSVTQPPFGPAVLAGAIAVFGLAPVSVAISRSIVQGCQSWAVALFIVEKSSGILLFVPVLALGLIAFVWIRSRGHLG